MKKSGIFRQATSIALTAVVLFTASASTLCNSLTAPKSSSLEVKSSDGTSKHDAQLPLAERETEEKEGTEKTGGEEDLTEKGQHLSAFILLFNESFLFDDSNTTIVAEHSAKQSLSAIPIYLSQHALRI
jgi:hypothetical protein